MLGDPCGGGQVQGRELGLDGFDVGVLGRDRVECVLAVGGGARPRPLLGMASGFKVLEVLLGPGPLLPQNGVASLGRVASSRATISSNCSVSGCAAVSGTG